MKQKTKQAWQKLVSLSFGYKQAEHLRAGFHGHSIYKAGKEQFIQGRYSEKPIDPMAEVLRRKQGRSGKEIVVQTDRPSFRGQRNQLLKLEELPTNSDADENVGQ